MRNSPFSVFRVNRLVKHVVTEKFDAGDTPVGLHTRKIPMLCLETRYRQTVAHRHPIGRVIKVRERNDAVQIRHLPFPFSAKVHAAVSADKPQ